jgi:hypothetical protein
MQLTITLPDRRLLVGVAIGALAGVFAVGAVTAASPSPSAPTAATSGASGASGSSSSSTAGTAKGPAAALGLRPGPLRQAIRNNFRVSVQATNRNGTHDILYVRGALTVGTNQVTVTLPDNSTQTFKVDSTTVVREQGKTEEFSDLTNGERAMVFGLKNADGSYTAKLIRCVKQPAANAGKPAAGGNATSPTPSATS